MTNDDLTPEERAALSSLPRERMPSAGLEDRVVAAMRERGHITRKPARVIRLTTSRVAGLVAACLVLMVGAYSIGLHGRVSHEVLKNIEPQPRSDTNESELMADREEQKGTGVKLPSTLGKVESRATAPNAKPEAQFEDKKAPAFQPTLNVPRIVSSKKAKEEDHTAKDEVTESMQKTFARELNQGSPAGATDLAAPSAPPMQSQLRAKAEMGPVSRRFALHGGTLIVDAPDSLRIITDEQGRTLLIYTSDGVIRIHLAD